MTTAIIVLIAVFVILGLFGLHVKMSLEKLFDKFETEEPLEESDIFAVFHENRK